jgi:propionyl-CoA synthetase
MSDGAATAYQSIYDASLRDPEGFWRRAAEGIDWVTPPTRILDDSRPPFYRWYPDAELNVCFNAVDRHVAGGRGEQAAIHYDSPVTGTKTTEWMAPSRAHASIATTASGTIGM